MKLAEFVRAHTRLAALEFLPELRIHLADEAIELWERTERDLPSGAGDGTLPPPFWAFAWAGGQALARYVLDRPELVAGRTVLDLASGSGLVAIAAARSGAAAVAANEIDELAITAIERNAEANGAELSIEHGDLLDTDSPHDVVLAGDVFYSRDMAGRMLAFLTRARARGARVLIGDPGRAYLPRDRFTEVAAYDVPVNRSLEDADRKRTAVLELN